MLSRFSQRQQQLLRALLQDKSGLTVDQLTNVLGITRTAVNQHLAALEKDSYVTKGTMVKTAGRPSYNFQLTEQGVNLFPKKYSWFSELLLESLKDELGDKGLKKYLHKLGAELAGKLKVQMKSTRKEEKIHEVTELMNTLGYEASAVQQTKGTLPVIEANNCVYHNLARQHNEVCELDISLLSNLLDVEVQHAACIVRGDNCCQFTISKEK